MRRVYFFALQVLRNILDFMVGKDVTSEVGDVGKQVQLMQDSVNHLTMLSLEQDMHHTRFRTAVAVGNRLADRIKRAFLQPLAELSKVVVPTEPEINVSEIRTFEGVIVTATNLATRFEESKALFVARGIKEDVADRLRAAVEELKKARLAKSQHFAARASATAAIQEEYARTRHILRVLDSMLESAWESSPEKLAQWRTVSHIAHLARLSKEEAPTDGGSTPGVPATTPAGVANDSPDDRVA